MQCSWLVFTFHGKNTEQKGTIGTQMLKSLITELRQRGFKAIETFARRSTGENPSGPFGFYMKNGFKIKHNGSDFPLMRLELVTHADSNFSKNPRKL
jgi:hypothetical protein